MYRAKKRYLPHPYSPSLGQRLSDYFPRARRGSGVRGFWCGVASVLSERDSDTLQQEAAGRTTKFLADEEDVGRNLL